MEPHTARTTYEFGEFRLDPVKRLLWRGEEAVSLLPKALDMLVALIEERGRVMEKEELMTRLWPDTIVEEANLSVTMSALRKALGESAAEHRYIVTIPRRGYRFVAEVSQSAEDETALIVEQHEVARVVVETERIGDEVTGRWGDAATERGRALTPQLTLARPLALTSRLAASPPLQAAFAVSLLALLGLGAAYWWRARESALHNPQSAIKSVAVLPFKPLRADAGEEYLGLGMADTLITKLGGLRALIVRPTSAVRKYAGAEQDALAAGREQRVDAVLDASLERDGNWLRVTARLLSVSDERTLWTYQCEEEYCASLFAMQDAISEKVGAALLTQLTGAEQSRLRKHYTENRAAYQFYLKGRYFLTKWTEPSIRQAIESFEQARAADANYALAYVGLADAWTLLGYQNYELPRDAFPQAEAAARAALKLDDALGEAHLSLAKIRLFYDWDWPGCERELQRALELNPNYPDVYGMKGTYLTALGKFDEASAARKRALEFDPLSPLATVQVGWPYFYARRYDEAIAWYRKALELDPNFAQAHSDIGLSSSLLKNDEQAVSELLKARALNGAKPETLEALRQAYVAGGVKGYAQKDLELLNAQLQQSRVRAWRMAGAYHALGDREQTFAWLERAYQERDGLLPFLKVMPQYADLHGDARFADLLRRIGLEN